MDSRNYFDKERSCTAKKGMGEYRARRNAHFLRESQGESPEELRVYICKRRHRAPYHIGHATIKHALAELEAEFPLPVPAAKDLTINEMYAWQHEQRQKYIDPADTQPRPDHSNDLLAA